jgi:putative Ca2+/H+ antiporter (TMEM165/GDT1 family)
LVNVVIPTEASRPRERQQTLVNRTMGALGALLAGFAVGLIGDRTTVIGVVIVSAAAALIGALSPLREAPSRD